MFERPQHLRARCAAGRRVLFVEEALFGDVNGGASLRASMPFALDDATRCISPTETLEYLAAHRRVVPTPVSDVVEPYGRRGLVEIVCNAKELVVRSKALLKAPLSARWRREEESVLPLTGWGKTWNAMWTLVDDAYAAVARTGSVA